MKLQFVHKNVTVELSLVEFKQLLLNKQVHYLKLC